MSPVYDWECLSCNKTIECFYKIDDKPEYITCDICQSPMKQVISAPFVMLDDAINVPWLSDFAQKRKEARFGHKPIETRQEYKQYLKEKDLRPADAENLSEV